LAKYDIIINAGDSIDVRLMGRLRSGLRKRKDTLKAAGIGGVGTLVHISGATSFLDGSKDGKWDPDAKIWAVCFFMLYRTWYIAQFFSNRTTSQISDR
jgi:hypothetical protein